MANRRTGREGLYPRVKEEPAPLSAREVIAESLSSTEPEPLFLSARKVGDYPFPQNELDFMDRAAMALHKTGVTPNKAYNEAHSLLIGRAAWLKNWADAAKRETPK